jgi:hypothetical protein
MSNASDRLRGLLSVATRAILKTLLFVVLLLPALALIEGAASLIHVGRTAPPSGAAVAQRAHTRYDAELGWVSLPHVDLPDQYGRGRHLTTNARGFRGRTEVGDTVPPGRVRVVCSGDSFTFGVGLADQDTWCRGLEALDPARETVNMGQGGYGIDQAWLWYRRDARGLQHQAQVFAFIAHDLVRMSWGEFSGYGKPRLRLDAGRVVVENVPVPRSRYAVAWLTRHAPRLRALRSVQLLDGLLAPGAHADGEAEADDPLPAVPLALAVFEDLAALNRAKGSTLLVVYLPDKTTLKEDPAELRALLARELAARGITFLDLTEDMRQLPRREAARLFLPDGHYDVPGARLVASRVDAVLRPSARPRP